LRQSGAFLYRPSAARAISAKGLIRRLKSGAAVHKKFLCATADFAVRFPFDVSKLVGELRRQGTNDQTKRRLEVRGKA